MDEEWSKVDGGQWPNRSILLPRLRWIRQSQGLTQRELARMAKVSSGTVYRLENELRGAYPATIRRLAAALELPTEKLVQEDRHE